MQEQIEQQAAYRQSQRTQSIDQTLQSQEAAKRSSGTGGNPSDLASMVAARAASRKPMTSSPTRKDFPPREDALERLGRSSTMDRGLEGARWVGVVLGVGGTCAHRAWVFYLMHTKDFSRI